MKDFNQLNQDQICSVKSCLKYYHKWLQYRSAKTFLFFWKQKEGFYYTYTISSPVCYTTEEIESGNFFGNRNLYVEGDTVYYYPHIEITMSNGKVYEKYFKTETELTEYMRSDDMRGIKWINQ